MKQKLLLTSEGIQPEIIEAFLSLLTKKPKDTKVLLITTAAYGESENVEWLKFHRKMLRNCGINSIEDLDLRFKGEEKLRRKLSDADVLYVAGGNTCFLLKYVRESGFDKLIKAFVKRGGLYVGNSAGSYIACPTIEQSFWKLRLPDKKRFGLTNYRALNLIPFWIVAHFSEKWRKDIGNAAKTTKYPIIALNDTQAVLVENGKWKIVGKGKREIFNVDKTP